MLEPARGRHGLDQALPFPDRRNEGVETVGRRVGKQAVVQLGLAVLATEVVAEGILEALRITVPATLHSESSVDLEGSLTVLVEIFQGGRALPFGSLVAGQSVEARLGIEQ